MQSFSYENGVCLHIDENDFHNKNFVRCLAFIMRFTPGASSSYTSESNWRSVRPKVDIHLKVYYYSLGMFI